MPPYRMQSHPTLKTSLRYINATWSISISGMLLHSKNCLLASGHHGLPPVLYANHNSVKSGMCYLKDTFLAITVKSVLVGPVVDEKVARVALWDLIPIGTCLGMILFPYLTILSILLTEANPVELQFLSTACVSDNAWDSLWTYITNHPVNKAINIDIKNWPTLLKLSRNIFCHEDNLQGCNIRELYHLFCGLFGGRHMLAREFLKYIYCVTIIWTKIKK
jgi:hypothetical protein